MTKQAAHVVALKAAFFRTFDRRVNVHKVGPAAAGCLKLSIPSLAGLEHPDRVLLVKIGGWLESQGFYQCHDHYHQGLLSSPEGWTCWEAGSVVLMRYRNEPGAVI